MEPIRILVTGGTFDKEYNELTGELFFQEHAHRRHAASGPLSAGGGDRDADDDRQPADDRRRAAPDPGAVRERARKHRIVITHGTDTMAETAAVLGEANKGKTVVLTGAMVPYTFGSSDGMFNLGTAMAFVQTLGKGYTWR